MRTGNHLAVKAISWQSIRQARNTIAEDFIGEVEALQHVSNWHKAENMESIHSHVLTADVIMTDWSVVSNEDGQNRLLYIVNEYAEEGDMCERIARARKFSEQDSRMYFRQLLKVRNAF